MATEILPTNGPEPGWYIYYLGQRFKLTEISSDGMTYHTVNVNTGELVDLGVNELLVGLSPDDPPLFAPNEESLEKLIDSKVPQPPRTASMQKLPDSFQERAKKIIRIMETVERLMADAERLSIIHQDHFNQTSTLERILRQLVEPIAISTFYKYQKLYKKWNGNEMAMATAMRRSTFHQGQVNSATIHMIDVFIMRWRGRHRPLRVGTLYNLFKQTWEFREGWWIDHEKCGKDYPSDLIAELLDHQIPTQALLDNPEKQKMLTQVQCPSRAWFYQYIKWFERFGDGGAKVFIAQHGRKALEDEWFVFDTFVTRAAYPLQYVFIDHWLVDVFIVDDETRTVIERLWFTAAIDAYSRCIIGFALLHGDPSIESVTTALKHIIWPKNSHLEYGIEEPYICWGVPYSLYLDNAWAHHSETLRQLIRAIGANGKYPNIELQFRPPYTGRRGALIERMFGNLSPKMKEKLIGAIQSSHPDDVRSAAKEASLLYEDIDKYLHDEVISYLHTPHSDLEGMTPHQKWIEGIQLMPPKAPPLTPQLERMFKHFEPKGHVINKDGIRAFGMHYWADELSGFPRKKGRKGILYYFSYDEADIHKISLFSADGIWLCDLYAKELRQPDGTYRSLSLAEKRIAQQIAKRRDGHTRNWLSHINEIDKLNETRQEEKRQKQRGKSGKSKKFEPKPEPTPLNSRKADQVLEQKDSNETYSGYTDLLAGFVGSEDEE